MRSSTLRCFLLSLLTLGVAWYTKVSIAQRHYEEERLDYNPVVEPLAGRERAIQFFED